jgi:hypothetical protein
MKSISSTVVGALVSLCMATVSGVAGAQSPATKQTLTQPSFPKGPHFIISVPVTLGNLPPEIDHYLITCEVYALKAAEGTGEQQLVAADVAATGGHRAGCPTAVGEGSAEGALGAAKGVRHQMVDVGVFVKPPIATGIAGASVANASSLLDSVNGYACSIGLQSTAYGATTTYFNSRVWSDAVITPACHEGSTAANANPKIPLDPAAPFKHRAVGTIPP